MAVISKSAPGRCRLITMRSDDQFNTTIYGNSGQLRGIESTRQLLLMTPKEIARAGLSEGRMVSLISDAEDGIHRKVGAAQLTPFDITDGCLSAHYPEINR